MSYRRDHGAILFLSNWGLNCNIYKCESLAKNSLYLTQLQPPFFNFDIDMSILSLSSNLIDFSGKDYFHSQSRIIHMMFYHRNDEVNRPKCVIC